jgi:hypothetical protein
LDYASGENISFFGTKYILDHKRPKTVTKPAMAGTVVDAVYCWGLQ